MQNLVVSFQGLSREEILAQGHAILAAGGPVPRHLDELIRITVAKQHEENEALQAKLRKENEALQAMIEALKELPRIEEMAPTPPPPVPDNSSASASLSDFTSSSGSISPEVTFTLLYSVSPSLVHKRCLLPSFVSRLFKLPPAKTCTANGSGSYLCINPVKITQWMDTPHHPLH